MHGFYFFQHLHFCFCHFQHFPHFVRFIPEICGPRPIIIIDPHI